MSENEKRERFGRYLILDHLVDGGMAKICRARFLGEQADKIVAIKMVRPQFSSDENFRTMFMDEIKTTFALIHPNIVQTYDYGMHKDQLFVAMEYCDGRNLKEYLDRLKERKFVFPVEISVYIISQVCQALQYAHTLTDKLTGKDANIIHRDISPHNLMLTFDGSVKVIDFGIAKSKTNSEATQAGTIKGKLSYLAPEYLEGLELDPRYDEFAVGITLWEMLCSRKLFKANNDLAVLKKIQECKVPAPSTINPNVPKELDEIVMKSLSKDRNNRFDDLDKFNRALIKFLYANYPDFNSSDLAYFAKELFKEEIKKDRERLFEFGKIDIKPYLRELKNESSGGGSSSTPKSSDGKKLARKAEEQELDFGFEEEESVGLLKKSKESTTSGLTIETTRGALGLDSTRSGTKLPKSVQKTKTTTGSTKTRTRIPKSNTKTKTKTRTKIQKSKKVKKEEGSSLVASVAAFLLMIGGAGYGVYQLKPELLNSIPVVGKMLNKNKANRVPTSTANKSASSAGEDFPFEDTNSTTATLLLKNYSKENQNIYVNGVLAENITVLKELEVPVGGNTVIRVEENGLEHFVDHSSYEVGSSYELEIPDNRPKAAYGYIFTSRSCPPGKIAFTLFTEYREEKIPLDIGKYKVGIPFNTNLSKDGQGNPLPKEHTISFTRDSDGLERQYKVTVNVDEVIDLCDIIASE